jgi:hypothetical protein
MNQDEERQLCESYYSRAIARAASDEEELAVALALLEGAERGGVVNDAGTGLIYISEPEIAVDADYLLDEETPRQRLRRIWPIVGAMAAVMLILLVRYGDWGGATEPTPTVTSTTVAIHLPTMTLTPAPTVSGTATPASTHTPAPTPPPMRMPTLTPTPAPPKEVEVKPEPVELEPGAVIPVSLEVAGRYFPVVPTTLRDEAWAYLPDPGRVSWLAGSTVNVVLGLPYSAENLDLVASTLALSDTLTLRSSVAGTNHYRLVERRPVGVYEIEALGQRRAGLTLVLVGGNQENPNTRIILWAVPAENKE